MFQQTLTSKEKLLAIAGAFILIILLVLGVSRIVNRGARTSVLLYDTLDTTTCIEQFKQEVAVDPAVTDQSAQKLARCLERN